MSVGNVLNQLDEALSSLFGQWNVYSTAIATLLALVITYSVVTRVDPEIHPMLLARQAQGSPIRNEGESPVYRGNSAPHGLPLNGGLNVKAPGASKWSQGRDGDLRDVWRRAVSGVPPEEGSKGKGTIFTVLGSEKVIEHRHDDITRQINLVGQHIASQGGAKVAIYLPNSVELIATLFACSFYDLTAILIPYDSPEDAVIAMLRQSGADSVVTSPGVFPFDSVVTHYPALKQLIWVVDDGNRHLDWNEVPQGIGGSINVGTWQDILNDAPVTAGTELPTSVDGHEPKDVVLFWPYKSGDTEMVQFTQKNLVSAISAQLAAVPTTARICPADLFLPCASLTASFPLVLTLAALYSNASVALNSVAGTSPDLALATSGVAPTVIVATPQTLLQTHIESMGKMGSVISRASHWVQTRSLVQNGAMPTATIVAHYNDSLRPTIGITPGKLRLVYVADSAGAGTPVLNERVLSDLRVLTGARVVYALTAARIAGSVAQTQYHDYRVHSDGSGSHFGAPVSSTEVLLRDKDSHKTSGDGTTIEGEIVVRGPAVVGGETSLGVVGKIREDNTLAYL